MYAFDYARPKAIADATAAHSGSGDAMYLAGGQTLVPTLKQRLRRAELLVDLADVSELKGIHVSADAVTIGAMTVHADVAASPDVRRAIPALAELAGLIGDPQVRNRGTVGGSIANNDPAADYPAALLALSATVHTAQRAIAADDFFTAMFETALTPGELIVKVSFPRPKRAAYAKFCNPASRYAIVGVMVAETAGGVRVAVTGAGPIVFRATTMEQALSKNFAPQAVKGLAVSPSGLNGDLHATPEYRAYLIPVMAARAVAQIAQDA